MNIRKILALACAACWTVAPVHAQTTLRFDVGFEGFVEGDMYLAAQVIFAEELNLGTTLFRYSPATREISEVMRLFGKDFDKNIAFDPGGRGLYICDFSRLQLLRPDGELIEIEDGVIGPFDLTVDSDGSIFSSDGLGIRSYIDGVSTEFNLNLFIRGLDLRVDGGLIASLGSLDELRFGDDNLLWLDRTGGIERRAQISVGALGRVRARSDGTFVVVSDSDSVLNLVQPDGSFEPISDRVRSATLTIDNDGNIWIGHDSGLIKLLADGTELDLIPSDLDMLGFPENGGFFSPFAIAIVPPMPTPAPTPTPVPTPTPEPTSVREFWPTLP